MVTKITFDAYTMGFSNRSWEDTLQILNAFKIQRLVDIRTLPGSKHTPQFNLEHMKGALPLAGVEYIHMKTLGGLRKPRTDSINAGWKNASFRGYADYMQTTEFDAAVSHLIELAEEKQTAIMCAEAVPWRCHRSLVADALVVRGIPVEHIMSETRRDPHRLIPFARRTGLRITYPTQDSQQSLL